MTSPAQPPAGAVNVAPRASQTGAIAIPDRVPSVGSLFSGAGGLDLAVEHVFAARTVWHCEVDPAASKVLAARWQGVPNLGDITAIDWEEIEPVDITGALLPTPASVDAERGPDFARANRDGSGGDDLVTACAKASIGANWGKYEPAIRRWETLTRPAPAPTEPNTKGNPRLNAAFSEWMLGWPDGWATAVPGISRNDALRIIGNGVVVLQAVAALRWLLSISEVAA